MYNEHFGLTDTPFSIAPDPRYLYMSEQHREALAHLVFGMSTGGGFILLTGEVGTGKTTVCRCLLEQVPDDANVALILNPKVKSYELLATICDELGIKYPKGETSIKALVDCINPYLLGEYAKGRRTVVILDEAQNLDKDVLEQLRLLTNLETNERKLLQIVMLGQPELLEMLASPDMRQLSQRITARYHLKALSSEDVAAYVRHRLSIAGLERALFPESTMKLLYRLSGGIPRRINLLCDRALLGGYVNNRNQVDTKILKKAAQEVLGEEKSSFASRIKKVSIWWLVTSVVMASVVAFGLGVVLQQEVPGLNEVMQSKTLVNTPGKNEEQDIELSHAPSFNKIKNEGVKKIPEKNMTRPNNEVSSIPSKSKEEQVTLNSSLNQSVKLPEVLPSGSSTATTLEKAYVALLAAWKMKLPEDMFDPCEHARSKGLGCLFKQGNMRSIIHMNRPVVLKLFDKNGQAFYVTFIKLQEDVATVTLENKEYRVKVSDLEERWFGDYTLIWKSPPDSHDGVIRFGDKGPQVLWLTKKLAKAQGKPLGSGTPDEFGTLLSKKIEVFQKSIGILPDGLARAVTLIHLNTATDSDVPLLK